MKEYETLKLYGDSLNRWIDGDKVRQIEVEYTEYDAEGHVIAFGTRDLKPGTPDFNNRKMYTIWTWDGKTRNKGGYRRFAERWTVIINRHDRKKLEALAAKWYPNAAAINVR